ncbi:MAG TPA: aldo/keto reductase [Streptosporangiaceae bacterium]
MSRYLPRVSGHVPWRPCQPSQQAQAHRQSGERSSPDPGGSRTRAPQNRSSARAPGSQLIGLALVHGCTTAFWWSAAVFASGAVICGTLLRCGLLTRAAVPQVRRARRHPRRPPLSRPQCGPARTRRTGRRPHGRRAAQRTFLAGRPGACLPRQAGRRRRVLRSGGWLPANSPQSLREQVHDNLCRLGLDVLDVVNLRTAAGSTTAWWFRALTRQFEALAELQQQGLIRHPGLSAVSLDQLA